jgi:hypothetical protein
MHLLLLLALASCAACEKKAYDDREIGNSVRKPDTQPRVHLIAEDGTVHAVTVEVVRSDEDVRQGLMYRRELGADAGMLFIMGEERVHTFWMKNTYIPLDMIFITKEMKVAGVSADAVPQTEDLRYVDRASSFVLEVNAGWAKAHGVDADAPARFENIEL